jgi:alpha-tubulin suppressor-like RCC1 family protein
MCSYRGKGDYFRLGHGTDTHIRRPQLVEGLKGKKIVHVAVGALHCLAVTDTGQVKFYLDLMLFFCAVDLILLFS